jgi:urease accessory protein
MNFMPARLAEIPAQRAVGRLNLTFRQDLAGPTRIETFYQQGCLKARLPRPVEAGVREAVTMNISGGVAGGDVLHTAITLAAGARVCVASAAAERVYRALNPAAPSQITTSITLGAGARLDYLPQETILFDGFALQRSLDISLAPDAEFLGVESLVFGRQAMGETLQTGWLRDNIRLYRGGALLFQDMTRLDGNVTEILRGRAIAAGNCAMASIIYAATDAAARLHQVRDALQSHLAGATVMDGVLRARILAPSAILLRRCVAAVLKLCRNGRPLPRVWQS